MSLVVALNSKVTPTSEVQAIVAVARASDLSGYFFVGFEGHWSEKIAYDTSAETLASALAGIPSLGEVNVSCGGLVHVWQYVLCLVS